MDLSGVKAFVFDIDGVFCSELCPTANGDYLRPMNAKDGYVVQYALKKGFPLAIISGARGDSLRRRFERLGVKDIYLNRGSKMEAYEDFIAKYGLSDNEVLYMGDDLPDYPVMKRVAFPVCPADAAVEIIRISKVVSKFRGGEGCVRDVVEQLLQAQGLWMDEDAFEMHNLKNEKPE